MNIIMEFKEKITKERQLKENWDQIKKYERELSEILLMVREVDAHDYILFFQSISLVLEYVNFYEDELVASLAKIEETTITDRTKEVLKNIPEELFDEIAPEMQLYMESDSDDMPIHDRLASIDKVRQLCWKRLYKRKEDIGKLCHKFPEPDAMGEEEYILLFKCLSMIILELSMKDQEIEILEKSKFQ